jgi:hypothetical protein
LRKGQKGPIVARIKVINQQIAAAENELADCIANDSPPTPAPPPLVATFTGVATMTTTKRPATGPFAPNVQLDLLIDGLRTWMRSTSFPTITTAPVSTPFGANLTTITKTVGGFGNFANGHIAVSITPCTSPKASGLLGDSDQPFILTTNLPGFRLWQQTAPSRSTAAEPGGRCPFVDGGQLADPFRLPVHEAFRKPTRR